MNWYFIAASSLTFILGIIHSVVGEILIFRHLREQSLLCSSESPILTRRQVRALRSSWHLVSLFGWGFAVILLNLSWFDSSSNHNSYAEDVMVIMFLASSLYWLIGTRGKHPAWIIFLIIGVLVWLA